MSRFQIFPNQRDTQTGLPVVVQNHTPPPAPVSSAGAAPARRRNRPVLRFEDGSQLNQETGEATGATAALWAQNLPRPAAPARRLELQTPEQTQFPETRSQPTRRLELDIQEPKPAKKEEIGQPKCLVQFEMRDGSQIKTYYHRTVVKDAMLILVMDTRAFVQTQYYPPRTDDDPFAVMLQGEGGSAKEAFLCYYVGMNFSDGHHDYTILMIDKQRKLDGEQQ